MSHIEVKNLKPTTFEDRYYDEYEYYNLTDRYTGMYFTGFFLANYKEVNIV